MAEEEKTLTEETLEGSDTIPMPSTSTVALSPVEEHHHGDTTTVFGRTFPVPLYTFVFFALAALTITEVVIAEVLKEAESMQSIKIIILSIIALIKGTLVVSIYMHLKDDGWAYRIAFLTPVIMALVAILFLVSVPTTGY